MIVKKELRGETTCKWLQLYREKIPANGEHT